MQGYLRLVGKYLGIDPGNPIGTDEDAYPVYADRDQPGGWERVELTRRPSGGYVVRFLEANRVLCLRPDGRLQSRPADAAGPWETLEQVSQPNGLTLLYRTEAGVLVPTVLSVEGA